MNIKRFFRQYKRQIFFLGGVSFIAGISFLALLGYALAQTVDFISGKGIQLAQSSYAQEFQVKLRHEVCAGIEEYGLPAKIASWVPQIEGNIEKWCPETKGA